jgi:hypothetical protein
LSSWLPTNTVKPSDESAGDELTLSPVANAHFCVFAVHAVSVVVVQVVLTPAAHVEGSAQAVHGVLPEVENVFPASHGTLHAVSIVVVQAALTPAAHVEGSAHAVHGVLPEVENVFPASHGGGGIGAHGQSGLLYTQLPESMLGGNLGMFESLV